MGPFYIIVLRIMVLKLAKTTTTTTTTTTKKLPPTRSILKVSCSENFPKILPVNYLQCAFFVQKIHSIVGFFLEILGKVSELSQGSYIPRNFAQFFRTTFL